MDSNPWWRAAATGGDRLAWRATDPVLAVRAPFDLGFTCTISHSWILRPTAVRVTNILVEIPVRHSLRVAIDGLIAAGKTTFADELAKEVRARGRACLRVSMDGFH
jgi:hypothetical protein